MAVNPNAVGFGLLDFDPLFEDHGFVVFRHKKERDQFIPTSCLNMLTKTADAVDGCDDTNEIKGAEEGKRKRYHREKRHGVDNTHPGVRKTT